MLMPMIILILKNRICTFFFLYLFISHNYIKLINTRYTIHPTFIYLIVILPPAIPVNIKLQVIAKKHHKVIILIKIYFLYGFAQ